MVQCHQQTLTSLSIECLYSSSTSIPSQFWKQLMEATSLKELSIESAEIYLEDWELAWKVLSSRLTSIGLSYITFCEDEYSDQDIPLASLLSQAPLTWVQSSSHMTTTSHLQQEMTVSTIEKLELRYIGGRDPTDQFEWILACPRIRSLVWTLGYEDGSDCSLLGFLMENIGCFPELTFLELEEDSHTPEELLAFLVTRTPGYRPEVTNTSKPSQSSGQFQGLDLLSDTFDSDSWIWMVDHLYCFKTVSVMNFANTTAITGATAQEMLCCLPNLSSFSANAIRDKDVWDDPRPWVCLKLERLMINLQLTTAPGTILEEHEPTAEEIQTMTMFLQRISGLRHLRLLDLSNYGTRHQDVTNLDLRLGHGLEQLSSLQELEELVLQRLLLNLEKAEIEWMAKNLLRLKVLDGTFHQVQLTHLKVREHYWSCRRKMDPNAQKHHFL